MKREEMFDCLPELVGREINKICYCEQESAYGPSCNLYIEFADGSHVEIYAEAELHVTGTQPYDPGLGSIVERTFARAKSGNRLAVKIDDTDVTVTYVKPANVEGDYTSSMKRKQG